MDLMTSESGCVPSYTSYSFEETYLPIYSYEPSRKLQIGPEHIKLSYNKTPILNMFKTFMTFTICEKLSQSATNSPDKYS